MYTAIYSGDFAKVHIDRDQPLFASMYAIYLNAYNDHCGSYLPDNKVEITRQECATEQVTTNGYGVETGRSCIRYVTVGTGRYADPKLYAAKKALDKIQATDGLRNVFKTVANPNAIGKLSSSAQSLQQFRSDMPTLFQLNGCNSSVLGRFEKNLSRFAQNEQPILLDGSTPSVTALSKNQNYAKLVDDLITDHARSWAINQYIRKSASGVRISRRDANNLPSELSGSYSYNGWRGRSRGTVRISLKDGIPDCIYFFDYPSTCRTPNRNIVARYLKGDYTIKE